MNLTDPEDHADAYVWASVLLAHGFLGLWGWLCAIFIVSPILAATLVPLAYFVSVEAAIQRFRAGMLDALVDTAGVAFGPLAGLVSMVFALAIVGRTDWLDLLQHPVPPSPVALTALGLVSIAFSSILLSGVWKRRKTHVG